MNKEEEFFFNSIKNILQFAKTNGLTGQERFVLVSLECDKFKQSVQDREARDAITGLAVVVACIVGAVLIWWTIDKCLKNRQEAEEIKPRTEIMNQRIEREKQNTEREKQETERVRQETERIRQYADELVARAKQETERVRLEASEAIKRSDEAIERAEKETAKWIQQAREKWQAFKSA